MIPKEILKKVKRIDIQTRGLVDEVFSGRYHSIFKGHGLDFNDIREYQPGDDIRSIDWNVSARAGHPYIKVFEEERELTVMLIADVSASSQFGTYNQMKGELAVEMCAVLAFSAIKNNDKIGLIIFSDRIEKYVPPKTGKSHVLRVLRELLYFKPEGKNTDISVPLEYLYKVMRKRATVFLVSDFLSGGFEKALRIAKRKHDIVAITVSDPRERAMPDVGLIEFQDAETGQYALLDTANKEVMEQFSIQAELAREKRETLFKSMNIDFINIFTDESYVIPFVKFFKKRAKRFH